MLLRDYFWFCAQGSILVVLGGSYMVRGLVACKARALTPVNISRPLLDHSDLKEFNVQNRATKWIKGLDA